MLVKASAQHGTNVSGEPEGIQHREQVEKGCVAGVTEPGFDGDGIVWMAPVSPWGVIQDHNAGEVTVDHREVLDVAAQLQSAVLEGRGSCSRPLSRILSSNPDPSLVASLPSHTLRLGF